MQDFLQNLEYQLKNIHLTDKAEAVQPFAHCPLQGIVEDYRDVVDGILCNLTFTSAARTTGGTGGCNGKNETFLCQYRERRYRPLPFP